MSRVLVSGGTGFTGQYLVPLLAERGHEVHALTRHAGETVARATAVHACDLSKADAIADVVAQVRPDLAVHLAAIANVAYGDLDGMYRSNVLGTRHFLQALAQLGEAPQRVLIASSANIYGNRREGLLTEDLPPAPANDYSVTKVATEALCSMYSDRLPITVARPFNYTGRGQATAFLIPKIVDHARRRAETIELGNLDVARDFSDVRMIAEVYGRLVEGDHGFGPFNVCSGKAVTLREVLDRVQEISGHKMNVQVNPAFVRAQEVRTLAGSPAKLEQAVGEIPHRSLDETLKWMLG